jgi:uncharacterized protein YprB with RNaseH-like and TPR domain
MGALSLLRKFLRLSSNSIGTNASANKGFSEPIFSNEITEKSASQEAKHKSDAEPLEKTATVLDKSGSKMSLPAAPNKMVKASKTDINHSAIALPVGEFIHNERSRIEYNNGILRNTFIHLKGIGYQKESALWGDGILTHDDALDKNIFATRRNCFQNSKRDLEDRNWYPFYKGMSSKDHWRLFGDLINETAYIDIETTGLGLSRDIITTAVVHSLRSTHVFVNGMNLERLPIHLSQFKLIVSYNGKSFDVPFMEKFFKTTIAIPHIDLRYVLSGMGHKGGLKSCEQQLRLPNREGMEEIDGYIAVLLWNYYCKNKDPKALETLLAYNYEDSVRLEWLMIEAYNQKISGLPFHSAQLTKPSLPSNPYRSHSAILRRI